MYLVQYHVQTAYIDIHSAVASAATRCSLASREHRTICFPMVPANVPKTARQTCWEALSVSGGKGKHGKTHESSVQNVQVVSSNF